MKYSPRVLALVAFLQVSAALASSAFIYCQTKLISSFELGAADTRYFLYTAIFFAAYLVLELVEVFTRERIFAVYAKKVKQKAASAFLHQSSESYASKSTEQQVSFFSNEVYLAIMQHLYLRLYIGKLLTIFLFALITLSVLAWQCSAVIMVVALSFGVIIHGFSRRLTDKQKRLQDQKSTFVKGVMEFYQGYEEIHINQMENTAEESFSAINSAAEQSQYDYKKSLLSVEVLGVGQTMMIYIFIILFGGLLAKNGVVGIGIFLSAAELSVLALNQWAAITRIRARIRGAKYVKDRVEEFIDTQQAPLRDVTQTQTSKLVEVKDLSYCCDNVAVIQHASFSMDRGRKYLVVGASGSGKSTLLDILVGHKSGYTGSVAYYTDQITYVPQNPFLFSGTLLENLVFDRKDIDMKRIQTLLQKVDLDISLDLVIEDDGKNLSGGQKTRVALVRALLLRPELLVADELTANLDQELGEKIEKLLFEEYPDISLVVAAHRTYCREQYDAVYDVETLKGNRG